MEKTLNSKDICDYQTTAYANLQSKLADKPSSCAVALSEADEGYSNE